MTTRKPLGRWRSIVAIVMAGVTSTTSAWGESAIARRAADRAAPPSASLGDLVGRTASPALAVVQIEGRRRTTGVAIAPDFIAAACPGPTDLADATVTVWKAGRAHGALVRRRDAEAGVCLIEAPTVAAQPSQPRGPPLDTPDPVFGLLLGWENHAPSREVGLVVTGVVARSLLFGDHTVAMAAVPDLFAGEAMPAFDREGRLAGILVPGARLGAVAMRSGEKVVVPVSRLKILLDREIAWQACRRAPHAACLLDEAEALASPGFAATDDALLGRLRAIQQLAVLRTSIDLGLLARAHRLLAAIERDVLAAAPAQLFVDLQVELAAQALRLDERERARRLAVSAALTTLSRKELDTLLATLQALGEEGRLRALVAELEDAFDREAQAEPEKRVFRAAASALLRVEAGLFDEAKAMLQGLEPPELKGLVQLQLGLALAKAGRTSEAASLLATAADALAGTPASSVFPRQSGLFLAARGWTLLGEHARARRALAEVRQAARQPGSQAAEFLLAELAEALAEAGAIDEAVAVLLEIPVVSRRASSLIRVAEHAAAWGDRAGLHGLLAEARRAARLADRDSYGFPWPHATAVLMALAGHVQEALVLLDPVALRARRPETLLEIARAVPAR